MRLLAICFLLFSFSVLAQRTVKFGRVVNDDNEGIPSVHIINHTAKIISVADNDGDFEIIAQNLDTIEFTSIGYESLLVIINQNWLQENIFIMQEESLKLKEITISSIPSIEKFKERVMEEKIEDSVSFWYHGVDKPVFRGDKMVGSKIHKNILYAVIQPTNFLHYNLSKKEKEKRKYYQIKKNSFKTDQAEFKFTRRWVQEHTGYEGDKLTSFIAFCNYPIDYLAKTPLYIILEDMLNKKISFEE